MLQFFTWLLGRPTVRPRRVVCTWADKVEHWWAIRTNDRKDPNPAEVERIKREVDRKGGCVVLPEELSLEPIGYLDASGKATNRLEPGRTPPKGGSGTAPAKGEDFSAINQTLRRIQATAGKSLTSECHVKLVHIGRDTVLDWFASALSSWPRWVSLPKIDGIPDGASVLDVVDDPYRRCFTFLVSHPSFPEVQPGEYPPPIVPYAEFIAVELWDRKPTSSMLKTMTMSPAPNGA